MGVVDYSHTFLAADSVVKPLVSKYLVPPCIGLGVGPRLSGFITHLHLYTNCGQTESIVNRVKFLSGHLTTSVTHLN